GGVDGQVRLEAPLDAALPRANDDARGALVDGEHLGVELHAHPELARAPHEESYEVRVEALQRPWAAMHDRHVRAGARGHVRELERDVAAADEDDAAGH